MTSRDSLKELVRTIPDFPKPGIQFRDISTLLADGAGFAASIVAMTDIARPLSPDRIVAIDARGFLFGAPVAVALGAGVIPARKRGKLPGATLGVDYDLEYGTDRLELHVGAVLPGHRALIVDALIATGGVCYRPARFGRCGPAARRGCAGRKPDGLWGALRTKRVAAGSARSPLSSSPARHAG